MTTHKTYQAWVDCPSIEYSLVGFHTEQTWLGYPMLVILDLGVNLVVGRIGGIFSTRDPDVNQPLLI